MGTTTSEGFNTIKCISRLDKKLENSNLNDTVMKEIEDDIQALSEYLGVSNSQAMLFAIIFGLQVKISSVDMAHIVTFLGINSLDALEFKNDLKILEDFKLLETDSMNSIHARNFFGKCNDYMIPKSIFEQIYDNKPLVIRAEDTLDILSFLTEVSDLIKKRQNDDMSTGELFLRVEALEQKCTHLDPINQIQALLDIVDRTLLYEIANDNLNYGFPSNMDRTMQEIYDSTKLRRKKTGELIDKRCRLCEVEYIELVEGRLANDFSLALTEKAIETFMQEDAALYQISKKTKNLLKCDEIASKKLFYDPELSNEISFLTQSLNGNKFNELQERLSNQKQAKGIVSIFYGSPGTGKTETAYQIAKATGRDILMVDISETKSMWFGESEKRIKEIFTNYKRICKRLPSVPILLFNEADAILTKRHENFNSNIGQTENAIQNILLEELERFEGIMIATTNLQGNLDDAYERRFLFKVKFDKPSPKIKSKIWMDKLNGINENFALQLAKEFDFSGGEIDNIVRKITMKEVISGMRPTNEEIEEICRKEKILSKGNGVKLGFV